jgi:hypothetical protein
MACKLGVPKLKTITEPQANWIHCRKQEENKMKERKEQPGRKMMGHGCIRKLAQLYSETYIPETYVFGN